MGKNKEYSNGEVTVVWKPDICIHAAKCVGNLPEVFKPKEKPWIKVDQANTEAIINAVSACPSGALSIRKDSEQEKENQKNLEDMKVQVMDNGPLLVHGTITLTHADGSVEEKEKITAFCRCGKSGNQPFCDGSHKN